MNITNIKSTFGYIGFIPFAVFSLLPWIIGGEISKTLIAFQIAYGSIIITFLGGFAWGWRDDQQNQVFNLSIGIGFSLIGCLILLLIFFDFILTSLIVSIIGFYLFYVFVFVLRKDHSKDSSRDSPLGAAKLQSCKAAKLQSKKTLQHLISSQHLRKNKQGHI